MVKIVVVYETSAGEHNTKTFAVLEVKDASCVMIAKAIKEYGLKDYHLDADAAIFVVKEEISTSIIRALIGAET